MVTDKATIKRIQEIVKKHYNRLVISVLGRAQLSAEELKVLADAGYDTSNNDSLLSEVYYHNFINHPPSEDAPKTVEQIKEQQAVHGLKPAGEAHDYSVESVNDKTRQYIDKLKLDVMTRIEGIIRENNDQYKMNALQNLDRTNIMDELVKESTLGKLKQKLRDTSHDGNRDWTRVAITEMSNAVGIASVDRIVGENQESDLDEIYVFRKSVNDSKTCKFCRRFYDDSDGTPKLYKLATLMSNGSNYGKKTDDWHPCIGATHPNERCSQTIELKPGWKLVAGGNVTYMGLDGWSTYISNKLSS